MIARHELSGCARQARFPRHVPLSRRGAVAHTEQLAQERAGQRQRRRLTDGRSLGGVLNN